MYMYIPTCRYCIIGTVAPPILKGAQSMEVLLGQRVECYN